MEGAFDFGAGVHEGNDISLGVVERVVVPRGGPLVDQQAAGGASVVAGARRADFAGQAELAALQRGRGSDAHQVVLAGSSVAEGLSPATGRCEARKLAGGVVGEGGSAGVALGCDRRLVSGAVVGVGRQFGRAVFAAWRRDCLSAFEQVPGVRYLVGFCAAGGAGGVDRLLGAVASPVEGVLVTGSL